MKGISIGVASDTREFSKGVKDGIIEPLEDASDALDDVAKDGDKAGDKLEKAFKAATKETSDFKNEQSELGRAMQRSSKEGGDAIRKNIKDGTDGAREGVEDLKGEAKQNAEEVASSFDGSAQSIADGFQSVAATAFAGFGPAGMVAGLAAAAGIGLISAALEDGGVEAEDLKQKISDLTGELIDNKGTVSIEYLSSAIRDLAVETEDGKTSLKSLSKISDQSGSSFKDLAQATGNNVDQMKALWREADKTADAMAKEQAATDVSTEAGARRYAQLTKSLQGQEKYLDYLGQAKGAAESAAEAERLYAEAGGPELEQKAEILSGLSDQISDAASSWDDYQNKETGAIDIGAYLANMQARIDANNNYVSNLDVLKAQMTPEAFAQVIAGGPDLAPLVDSVAHASPEIQAQFAATYAAAAAQANGQIAGIDSAVDVTVTAKADTKPATADIFKVKDDKSYLANVNTKATTGPATQQIKDAAAQSYSASIDVGANLNGAQAALDSFLYRNSGRTITVNVKGVTPDGKQVF